MSQRLHSAAFLTLSSSVSDLASKVFNVAYVGYTRPASRLQGECEIWT